MARANKMLAKHPLITGITGDQSGRSALVLGAKWASGGLGCHLGYTDQSRSQSVIDRPLKDRPPKPTAMADAANGPLPGEAFLGWSCGESCLDRLMGRDQHNR